MDDLNTVFPKCAMWYIKAEQFKDAIIFEETISYLSGINIYELCRTRNNSRSKGQ